MALAYLLRAGETSLDHDSCVTGTLFETFVVMELLRQSEWQPEPVSPFHYRDKDGREIDVVLERRDGTVIGIDVKSL